MAYGRRNAARQGTAAGVRDGAIGLGAVRARDGRQWSRHTDHRQRRRPGGDFQRFQRDGDRRKRRHGHGQHCQRLSVQRGDPRGQQGAGAQLSGPRPGPRLPGQPKPPQIATVCGGCFFLSFCSRPFQCQSGRSILAVRCLANRYKNNSCLRVFSLGCSHFYSWV